MSLSPSETTSNNSNRMSKLVQQLNHSLNDLGFDSSSQSQEDYSSSGLDDECVSPIPSPAPCKQQASSGISQPQFNTDKQFQLNYNLPSDLINSSFKDHTFNTSGLGDSLSLPCDLTNSSMYASFMANPNSNPPTPTTPPTNFNNDSTNNNNNNNNSATGNNNNSASTSSSQKINPNAPAFTSMVNRSLNQPKQSNFNSAPPMDLMSKCSLKSNDGLNFSKNSGFYNLPMGLGQNMSMLSQVDYDPFNDYMGMDRNMLQINEISKKQNMNMDHQQQQQQQQHILAQMAAAAAANNFNHSGQSANKTMNPNKSVSENIELLNSKFNSQKIGQQQSLNEQQNSSNSINSLLATVVAAANGNANGLSNDYNSPNLPTSLKRQSGAFNPAAINQSIFSPQITNTSSPNPQSNNRLNMFASIGSNEQNRNQNVNAQLNSCSDKLGSISASNSAFNLSLSGNNSLETVNANCYDDDDVFSAPNSNYSSMQASNAASNNNNNNSNNQNLDSLALVQLYRNFLNMNNANNNNMNNNNNNWNDLLSSYNNLNLAAFPDLLNTLTGNSQFKANSATNNTNNPNQMLSPAAFAAAYAANTLKQRQNMLFNNRSTSSGSTGAASNIAALTSVTNNIVSLLNNANPNQINLQQQQQQQQNQQQNIFMNQNTNQADKRRINSTNSFNNNNNQSGLNNTFNNNASLCLPNVGPNASHLLQNSSMASSARLNASNQASAAVLGQNSSLNHTLSSLHQNNNSQNQSSLLNFNNNSNQSNLLNFNASPNSANNSLLSAFLLSQTNGGNTVLSSSGKPLRSERLPQHVVDEIVRQAKIRRKNGGKKEVCVFCRNNGEKEQIYTSHTLKDASNHVACPILRLYQCPICHASGDQAHTIKYCPFAEKDSACIKLFKETGRMNAAFLNSFATGVNTPPSLTPPDSPPPQLNHQSNLN